MKFMRIGFKQKLLYYNDIQSKYEKYEQELRKKRKKRRKEKKDSFLRSYFN